MRRVALYIPGLGDHYDNGRAFLLKGWRLWGIEARLVPINWYGKGSYEDKLILVETALQTAKRQGYAVTLVGESAGASLALNAASKFPGDVEKVIVIAGVNSSKLPISPRYNALAPVFVESAGRVSQSVEAMDRTKIHTVRGLWDPVVSPRFNDIKSAQNHTIFSIGHFTTIALCLSVLSGFIVHLIKRSH
jgi:pimeloyl-ACP methyl ester carboxylesterase